MQKTMEKTTPPARQARKKLDLSENKLRLVGHSFVHYFGKLDVSLDERNSHINYQQGKFQRMGNADVAVFLASQTMKHAKAGKGQLAQDCVAALDAHIADLSARPEQQEHACIGAYLHFEKGGNHPLAEKYAREAVVLLAAQGKSFENERKWLAAAQTFAKITHLVKDPGEKAEYHDGAYQNFARAEEPLLAAKQAHAAFDELKSAREGGFTGKAASDSLLHAWAERAGWNYWNAHDRIDVVAAPDKEEARRERARLMELVRVMGQATFQHKLRKPQI